MHLFGALICVLFIFGAFDGQKGALNACFKGG
jgi:hypothetical protein